MIIWSNTGDKESFWPREDNGKNGRVMLVSGHALFRQALAVVLERRAGFHVCSEASSSAEARMALDAVEDGPDLAVVDLDLRDGGAGDLIREMAEGPSGTTVLGLTASRERATETSPTALVLTTDVSVDEILAAARQLIG